MMAILSKFRLLWGVSPTVCTLTREWHTCLTSEKICLGWLCTLCLKLLFSALFTKDSGTSFLWFFFRNFWKPIIVSLPVKCKTENTLGKSRDEGFHGSSKRPERHLDINRTKISWKRYIWPLVWFPEHCAEMSARLPPWHGPVRKWLKILKGALLCDYLSAHVLTAPGV